MRELLNIFDSDRNSHAYLKTQSFIFSWGRWKMPPYVQPLGFVRCLEKQSWRVFIEVFQTRGQNSLAFTKVYSSHKLYNEVQSHTWQFTKVFSGAMLLEHMLVEMSSSRGTKLKWMSYTDGVSHVLRSISDLN